MELNTIRPMAQHIISAMIYLHSKDMCHRDLKPENILVKNNIIKIGDFGLSRVVPASDENGSVTLSVVGTRSYMAPEMATAAHARQLGAHYDPKKVDAFAVGVILFEMAVGMTPFSKDELIRTDFEVMAAERVATEQLVLANSDFSQMVRALLKWNPSERAYIADFSGNNFLR